MASVPSSSYCSYYSSCPAPHHPRRRFRRSLRPPPLPRLRLSSSSSRRRSAPQDSQFGSIASRPTRRRGSVQIATSFDDDLGDFSLVHDDGDDGFGVVLYSSESEWSDDDVVLAFEDVELPMMTERRFKGAECAITIAAHRLAAIEKGHRKSRTQQGLMNNVGLIAFLAMLLLFVDWCSWRIVKLPLVSFYLTRPF